MMNYYFVYVCDQTVELDFSDNSLKQVWR